MPHCQGADFLYLYFLFFKWIRWQGLGKTISTIALILKERSPSSRLSPIDTKQNEIETLNLDEDDDSVCELDGPKQDRNNSVQAKGRLAAGTLVVCPTSVLRQWADELQNKVTTKANLSVLVYYGGNRTKDPFELAKYDVVLTTYSIEIGRASCRERVFRAV